MLSLPKVSIVVPVYNVELYLRECLESLVNQTLSDIEVIMVNDGSTDSSPQIMDEYAEKYPNFNAYHKSNGGLGNARNYGIQFANGEYLAFVDSDDYLALDAYEKMYRLGQETEAELVIGNVLRFNSKKKFESSLHKRAFKEAFKNTTVKEYPSLIYNTTSWNNLFKMEFWKRNGLFFPENILYEDIPVMIPAYFLSRSTSILNDVVYYWRVREGDDKSISQRRTELQNFTDRMKVIGMVDAFYDQFVDDPILLQEKDFRILSLDLIIFINQIDKVDERYKEILVEEVNSYIKNADPKAFERLSALNRIKYALIQQKKIKELIEVIHFERHTLKYSKIKRIANRYFGNYPYQEMLPHSLYDITDELNVVCKIEEVRWKNSTLIISGYSFINKLNSRFKTFVKMSAKIANENCEVFTNIPVKISKRKDVTWNHGIRPREGILKYVKRVFNYNWSGYELSIDFERDEIKKIINHNKLDVWLTLTVGEVTREFKINGPIKGKKSRAGAKYIANRHVVPFYNPQWEFGIDSTEIRGIITDVFLDQNNELSISGYGKEEIKDYKLVFFNNKTQRLFNINEGTYNTQFQFQNSDDYKGLHLFNSKIQLNGLLNEQQKWLVGTKDTVHDDIEELKVYTLKKKFETVENFDIHYRITEKNGLNIFSNEKKPYISSLEWNENGVSISVCLNSAGKDDVSINECNLIMQSLENGEEKFFVVKEIKNDHCNFDIRIRSDDGYSYFSLGRWAIFLSFKKATDFGGSEYYKKRIQQSPSGKSSFSKMIQSGLRFKPYITGQRNVNIKVDLEWNWLERGPRHQKVLRKIVYPLLRFLPIDNNLIVFQSYWGKSYNCNPRALYEYMQDQNLKYKYVWGFINENTRINGNAKKVRINSLKYFYYMARAKYFVHNVNFADFYKKRASAVELQTLHGTALKTLGLDVPGDFETKEKEDRFIEKCNRWDYLTSPSGYMTDISKRCFLYKNEVIEYGFPRNDILFLKNEDTYISEIKNKLNLPLNKNIVLYAPTWRIKNEFEFKLDLKLFKEELGEDYIILLRLHHYVSSNINIDEYRGFVYNLSSHDDIQELYLISDILITDYSSVMFDFSNLRRPIIFFTYDLENYRDQLRGLYIDFEREAPGPLVRTTEELIKEIKENESRINPGYKQKYQKFLDKYCEFESGQASKKAYEIAIKGKGMG